MSKLVTAADILQNANGGADSVGTVLLMNHTTQDIWQVMALVEMLFDKHFNQPHQFIRDCAGAFDRFAHL